MQESPENLDIQSTSTAQTVNKPTQKELPKYRTIVEGDTIQKTKLLSIEHGRIRAERQNERVDDRSLVNEHFLAQIYNLFGIQTPSTKLQEVNGKYALEVVDIESSLVPVFVGKGYSLPAELQQQYADILILSLMTGNHRFCVNLKSNGQQLAISSCFSSPDYADAQNIPTSNLNDPDYSYTRDFIEQFLPDNFDKSKLIISIDKLRTLDKTSIIKALQSCNISDERIRGTLLWNVFSRRRILLNSFKENNVGNPDFERQFDEMLMLSPYNADFQESVSNVRESCENRDMLVQMLSKITEVKEQDVSNANSSYNSEEINKQSAKYIEQINLNSGNILVINLNVLDKLLELRSSLDSVEQGSLWWRIKYSGQFNRDKLSLDSKIKEIKERIQARVKKIETEQIHRIIRDIEITTDKSFTSTSKGVYDMSELQDFHIPTNDQLNSFNLLLRVAQSIHISEQDLTLLSETINILKKRRLNLLAKSRDRSQMIITHASTTMSAKEIIADGVILSQNAQIEKKGSNKSHTNSGAAWNEHNKDRISFSIGGGNAATYGGKPRKEEYGFHGDNRFDFWHSVGFVAGYGAVADSLEVYEPTSEEVNFLEPNHRVDNRRATAISIEMMKIIVPERDFNEYATYAKNHGKTDEWIKQHFIQYPESMDFDTYAGFFLDPKTVGLNRPNGLFLLDERSKASKPGDTFVTWKNFDKSVSSLNNQT